MRQGEQCSGVCGPPALPHLCLHTGELHEEALPPEALTPCEFCQNSRLGKGSRELGLQHRNAGEERVFKEEKELEKVLAPHLWLCLPAEVPGEAELPVLAAWEMALVLYILKLS